MTVLAESDQVTHYGTTTFFERLDMMNMQMFCAVALSALVTIAGSYLLCDFIPRRFDVGIAIAHDARYSCLRLFETDTYSCTLVTRDSLYTHVRTGK